ncbi:MAG: site-specific integrase [Cyanobacteria bacterium J06573_2]
MENIQGRVFGDFEPPATTDGSYRGRKKMIEATDKHYQMKLDQELSQINERLKASKIRVRVLITSGTVQLQATLPLKPGDTHKQGKQKKQYKISLGLPANFDGLKTAEEEAQELGKLIARQTFVWTDKYLGVRATKDKGITFREFYDQFERRYFEIRKRTRKSEGTFIRYKSKFKHFFLSDLIITENNLKKIITNIQKPGTRNDIIKIASIVSKMLNIEIDFSNLKLKIPKLNKSVPTDKEIVVNIDNFENYYQTVERLGRNLRDDWKFFKIVYGLMATYGLRPIEVINKPDLEWFVSSDNAQNTFKVHESNKTGYREVIPFVPEWVELFDLKNEENINKLKARIAGLETSEALKNKVNIVSKSFKRVDIYFQPYTLRHACAIRAHLQGVPIKAAADNLGHTIEIHTRVYQHWFGFDNRVKAFNQAFEEQNEVEKLKDELIWYKKRVGELEIENTRLKLQNNLH